MYLARCYRTHDPLCVGLAIMVALDMEVVGLFSCGPTKQLLKKDGKKVERYQAGDTKAGQTQNQVNNFRLPPF